MSAQVLPEAYAPPAAPPIAERRPRVERFSTRSAISLLVGDLLMFLLSGWIATHAVASLTRVNLNTDHIAISTVVYVSLWIGIFHRLGLYSRSFAMSIRDEMYATITALCLGMAPQLILFTIVPSISSSRLVLLTTLAISIVTVSVVRAIAHRFRDVEALTHERRIILIGASHRVESAQLELRTIPNARLFQCVVDDIDATLSTVKTSDPTGFYEMPWFLQALQWDCDSIVFTEIVDPRHMPRLLEVSRHCGLSIAFAPPRIRSHAYSLSFETVGQQMLIVPKALPATTPWARISKRIFDVALAAIATLIFSPLMGVVALLLWLERSGPIFYTQTRVGRFGTPFEIIKFRSMRTDAEKDGARLAVAGDSRVTKLGRILRRTSLDELPQLFNVLRGDMSIVGPRPERPVFVEAFRAQHDRYDERHLVLPGITGWSQVNLKRVLAADDVSQKLMHDLFYVENWSLFMDVSVVVKTAAEVLFHRAA